MTDEIAPKGPSSEDPAGSSGGAARSGKPSKNGGFAKAIAALVAVFVLGGAAGVAVGRVTAMREAWVAAMAGEAIEDAARTRPALQAALGFW